MLLGATTIRGNSPCEACITKSRSPCSVFEGSPVLGPVRCDSTTTIGVSTELLAKLLSSIKRGARIVLFGDPEQLPPVEAGNLFQEIIELEEKSVQTLHLGFRAEKKEVVEMAELIKHGKIPRHSPLPSRDEIIKLVRSKLGSLENFQKFRVLAPLRAGPYGIDQLNHTIFEAEIKAHSKPLIPILIVQNDASNNLANGDQAWLNLEAESATFLDGRTIAQALLPSYTLAYVLSIHRSQGSEYDEVIVLLPEGSEDFGRELLYTAATRAKKSVRFLWKQERC